MSSQLRPRSARPAPARVLVVNADAALRRSLVDQLVSAGRFCKQAASAHQALVASAQEAFDLVVMDARLARDCGDAIRSRDPEIGLILVTDTHSAEAAAEATRMGAAGLLTTPVLEAELLDAVEGGLRWRRSARTARTATRRLQREIEVRSSRVAAALADLSTISAADLETLFTSFGPHGLEMFEHGARTAVTAVAMAQTLACSDAETAKVGWGALLHDVGKLTLPSVLLGKPGPLTAEEAAVVRTHPEIGADILRVVPLFHPIADIVRASHERYDGGGYPRYLRGTAIPLGARITAVADSVDVMVHGRNYREPLSSARAAAELVRGAGGQFDPDVVHAWFGAADRLGICA